MDNVIAQVLCFWKNNNAIGKTNTSWENGGQRNTDHCLHSSEPT
jgi:hypothetical protein